MVSLLLLLAVAKAQQLDETPLDDSFDEPDDDSPFLESSQQWRDFSHRMQRSIDSEGLIRARRIANVANAALLTATGPVSLAVSLLSLKLSNIVLSTYVTALGGVLFSVELGLTPVAPWVRNNLAYFTTPAGRTALLAFLGGLTWPLGRLGLVPAMIT